MVVGGIIAETGLYIIEHGDSEPIAGVLPEQALVVFVLHEPIVEAVVKGEAKLRVVGDGRALAAGVGLQLEDGLVPVEEGHLPHPLLRAVQQVAHQIEGLQEADILARLDERDQDVGGDLLAGPARLEQGLADVCYLGVLFQGEEGLYLMLLQPVRVPVQQQLLGSLANDFPVSLVHQLAPHLGLVVLGETVFLELFQDDLSGERSTARREVKWFSRQ